MNTPENAIGTLGLALGLLRERGWCYASIDGDERYFAAYMVPGVGWLVTAEDALRLLEAEEVR